MKEPILSVKFFCTEADNEPVRDFLLDLPPEDRKIIGTDIKEVQFGWPLGMPLLVAKWCCSTLLSRGRIKHPKLI